MALLSKTTTRLLMLRLLSTKVAAQAEAVAAAAAATANRAGKSINHKPIKSALVVTKASRYEREQQRLSLSGPALHAELERMGLNVPMLQESRDAHESGVLSLLNVLSQWGISTRLVRHTEFKCGNEDVVIAAGGDGTFLQSARRIGKNGPIILGVNTDSTRSKGYFCGVDASRPGELGALIPRLCIGDFEIVKRCRIKIRVEHVSGDIDENFPYVLNEVFFAERDASKPSQLAITVDGEKVDANKSSGVIVSTGSGSTAWIYAVARITPDQISQILRVMHMSDLPHDLIKQIARDINRERLIYDCDVPLMQYVVREPLDFGERDVPLSLGRAERITMRSLGLDATFICDGIGSTDVTVGDLVILEMPESAVLHCVSFKNSLID